MLNKSREGSIKLGENSGGGGGESGGYGGGGGGVGEGINSQPLDRSSIECKQENSVFTSNSGLVSLKFIQ